VDFVRPWLSTVAIILTVAAFAPYIRAIIRGVVRPHIFSWVIWGTTTFVVFLAQLEEKGGAGAWPTGFSAMLAIFIALLAWVKRADVSIGRLDWIFFAAAMSSLPLWFFTADPLWAVVLLTTVDILGFGPTVRKAWRLPHSESLLFFALFTVRNLVAISALANFSVATVLFPAAVAAACMGLIAVVAHRRRALAAPKPAVAGN
jgi:hypothetical protein